MKNQDRAARTRHALIRSAAELFEQRGYVQARLAAISTGAGVSTGALHFHFENKAALADALEDTASQSLRHAAHQAQESQTDTLQSLADTSHVLASLLRRDVVARAGFRLNCDTAWRPVPNLRREWHGCVLRLLSRAGAEGSLAAGVPRRKVAAILVAATTGLEVLGMNEHEWLSRTSVTGLWQLLAPRIATLDAQSRLNPAGTGAVIDRAAGLCVPDPDRAACSFG